MRAITKKSKQIKQNLKKTNKKINKTKKNRKSKLILQRGGENRFEDDQYDKFFRYRTLTLDLTPGLIENTTTMKLRYGFDGNRIANLKTSITHFLQDKKISNVTALKQLFRQSIEDFYEQPKGRTLFKDEYDNLDDIILVIKNNDSVVANDDPLGGPSAGQSAYSSINRSTSLGQSPTYSSMWSESRKRNPYLPTIDQTNKASIVIIDMDLIFTNSVYQLCNPNGAFVSKDRCISLNINNSLLGIAEDELKLTYFQHYEQFKELLAYLKYNDKLVLLTSKKLHKTILKAFLALSLKTLDDVLVELLRGNDRSLLIGDPVGREISGKITSDITGSRLRALFNDRRIRCQNFSFLDKYIVVDRELQSYPKPGPSSIILYENINIFPLIVELYKLLEKELKQYRLSRVFGLTEIPKLTIPILLITNDSKLTNTPSATFKHSYEFETFIPNDGWSSYETFPEQGA